MLTRHPVKGFTLIEMLIALSLLGVMVVLLFASLRTAAESWNNGEDKISQVNQKAVVYQFFKRHLQITKPLPPISSAKTQPDQPQDGSEQRLLEFQGMPQSIHFISSLPAASARKGLQIFVVGLDSRNPTILKVALLPYRQIEDEGPPDEPTVLLEGLSEFKITYFGENAEGSSSWQETWQNIDHLPKLVKVHIGLQDGSFWPDMIFPLKISEKPLIGNAVADPDVPGINNE